MEDKKTLKAIELKPGEELTEDTVEELTNGKGDDE